MLRVQKHGEEGRKEFFFFFFGGGGGGGGGGGEGGGGKRLNGKFIKDGKEVADGRSWQ